LLFTNLDGATAHYYKLFVPLRFRPMQINWVLFCIEPFRLWLLLQARKVTFYRNGDQFFKGLVYAVKPMQRKMEPYEAFERLLADVCQLILCIYVPFCLFYGSLLTSLIN